MSAELIEDGTIELEIRREFPFPRELVFDAWVNEDHLYKWMGPTDEITMADIKVDAREGGAFLMTYCHPDGDRSAGYWSNARWSRSSGSPSTWARICHRSRSRKIRCDRSC